MFGHSIFMDSGELNSSLFVRADGRPLCFCMTHCPKRKEIQPLIEVMRITIWPKSPTSDIPFNRC
jgi:hypothetical protein